MRQVDCVPSSPHAKRGSKSTLEREICGFRCNHKVRSYSLLPCLAAVAKSLDTLDTLVEAKRLGLGATLEMTSSLLVVSVLLTLSSSAE